MVYPQNICVKNETFSHTKVYCLQLRSIRVCVCVYVTKIYKCVCVILFMFFFVTNTKKWNPIFLCVYFFVSMEEEE